ncbi:hypothetical protein FACS1894130_00590 [Spirochaetia bacterium]|nr:hypothetical protein FACS1894130_00590 [Spirochaetia bacterium]
MKNLFAAVAAFALLASCASAPSSPPPEWARDVQRVYPRSEYVTGRGEGASRQEAENKALAEIAFYFVREITASQSTRTAYTTRDGATSEDRRTEEHVLVESQTRLVAVRYAEDPWYNRTKKAWETVAYINRDEGWTVYEPAAKKQADAFLQLVQSAEAETEASESFNAVLRYGNAEAYAESAEFNTVRNFAQALHPVNAAALFGETDAALAGLPQKQLAAREKATVYIDCPVDHDKMIYQAMVRALGASGFAVETNRSRAQTVCAIRVEEGAQQQSSGVMYYPALSADFSGRKGALFSFRIQAERQGAVTPEVAKRRAYTALAAALENGFEQELRRRQSALVKD